MIAVADPDFTLHVGDVRDVLLHNTDVTAEQFSALAEMLWTFYPSGWPDGETVTFSSGLEVKVKVAKNK